MVQVPQTGLELLVLKKESELLVLLPLSLTSLGLKAGIPILVLFILLLFNFLVTSLS